MHHQVSDETSKEEGGDGDEFNSSICHNTVLCYSSHCLTTSSYFTTAVCLLRSSIQPKPLIRRRSIWFIELSMVELTNTSKLYE